MTLDELPNRLGEFVELARAALSREITAAKNIATAAKAETATAQNALAELRDQHKQAQSQLDAVMKDLQRFSDLAAVGHDIDKARKELARLKAETAKTEKALEARLKQCTEADSRLVGLNLEANRMIAIRTEGEAVMADIKAKLNQVQLGQRT
jgi:chromosome segregation ATPase